MRNILFLAITLFFSLLSNAQSESPKLGEEKELVVTLTALTYGDVNTVLTFEPVGSKPGSEEIFVSQLVWTPGAGSVHTDMDSFNESLYGKKFKIRMKYSELKEMDYKGEDLGLVATGNVYNDWVLVKIQFAE
jgi:hypothetical protein